MLDRRSRRAKTLLDERQLGHDRARRPVRHLREKTAHRARCRLSLRETQWLASSASASRSGSSSSPSPALRSSTWPSYTLGGRHRLSAQRGRQKTASAGSTTRARGHLTTSGGLQHPDLGSSPRFTEDEMQILVDSRRFQSSEVSAGRSALRTGVPSGRAFGRATPYAEVGTRFNDRVLLVVTTLSPLTSSPTTASCSMACSLPARPPLRSRCRGLPQPGTSPAASAGSDAAGRWRRRLRTPVVDRPARRRLRRHALAARSTERGRANASPQLRTHSSLGGAHRV